MESCCEKALECLLTQRPKGLPRRGGCSLRPDPWWVSPRKAGMGLGGPVPIASQRGSQLKQVFRSPEVLRAGLAVSIRTSQPTSRGLASQRPSNFPHLCTAGFLLLGVCQALPSSQPCLPGCLLGLHCPPAGTQVKNTGGTRLQR